MRMCCSFLVQFGLWRLCVPTRSVVQWVAGWLSVCMATLAKYWCRWFAALLAARRHCRSASEENEQQLTSRGPDGAHFGCAGVANGKSQRQQEQEQSVGQESITKMEARVEFGHVEGWVTDRGWVCKGGMFIAVELISNSSVHDERWEEVMGSSVVACVWEVEGVRRNGTRHRG